MTIPFTFLFTDLVDSTRLWEQVPEAMRPALARHDALLKKCVESHNGRIVKTTGDGLHAVFESPSDAVSAALAGQLAIGTENWSDATVPIKVKMGLHTGESQEREGDYYGSEVNLAARVMGLAYGGQVLLSEITAGLVKKILSQDCSLADLGKHRVKGVAAPERIFQLCHPDLTGDFPPLKSLGAFKHNLPRQLSTFIGRENEIAQVKHLLAKTQLLTLLGPGGTGKTRLMMQVAEEVIDEYPDGVWLVELAPLTDPDLIPDRVASALNVQEQPGRKLFESLVNYLRRKNLLLLLDNVEHIVRESAEFSEHLLSNCPKLKMFITGREAFFIAGETTLQIPSLSLPEKKGSVEEISNTEGVQLFLERARAVRPDFVITENNAANIADIVRRLDGIPLALELAAARLRMLTIEQIKDRLNDRFRLLTGGRRTALPRQQTLQALIDWSWKLLNEKERIFLRRLSVFSGGWNLEAAQSIAGFDPLDEFDGFDLLEQLINKSLVMVDYPPGGEARYGLLESIRQFSRDKLFEAQEGETLRDRHAEFFVGFAQESEYHLFREGMVPRVNRILHELDNIRAVLAWTLEDDPVQALKITSSLLYHWAHWIHPSEARGWLESSIEQMRTFLKAEPSETQVEDFIKAHIGLGVVHALFGDNETAITVIEQGIELAEEYDELGHMTFGIAWKTNVMILRQQEISPEWMQEVESALELSKQRGFWNSEFMLYLVKFYFLLSKGEFAKAEPYFQRLVQGAEELNNPRVKAGVLQVQARMATLQGDSEAAKNLYFKAVDEFIAINDLRNVLTSNSELAHIYRREGNLEKAVSLYCETIRLWQDEGSRPALAHQFECFAYIAISQDNLTHAARLLGRARATREAMNALSTDPIEIGEWEQAMAELSEAMTEPERDRVMEEGSTLSLDEAVDLALKEIL